MTYYVVYRKSDGLPDGLEYDADAVISEKRKWKIRH